jgi:Ca-activated chloride channel homolog
MRKSFFLLVIFVFSAACVLAQDITQGSLYAVGKQGRELGECPLKRTTVTADISGFMTRVKVVQEFENNFNEPIEAVYTFPLSQNSAVDDMTMRIGERTIRGRILQREEARKVYETAKTEGKTASLLDQERPNIFTQSVANILPNEKILIEISYVETLKFEDGAYEFVFPMVVGPRYIPASVQDAQKISPPIDATRAGHNISIEVNLDAGVAVGAIRSSSHEIQTSNLSATGARISLKDGETIPNKDFVLRYDVTGQRIADAFLTHKDERGGFFTLMLQPPDKFSYDDVTPKEIVFVLDTSGSMSGFPIEKAKEAMRASLENLYPYDTFNLITFAGDTEILFEKPVPATQANLETALKFLDTRNGDGGTEMMKAVTAALAPSDSQEHIRVVCFMTDGYVGNEAEIIAEVQKHPKARVFSFGIGESVNRFLLDKMAHEGRGEVEYVSLKDDGSRAAKRFYERVRTPLLTDISVEWNGLPVADVYPNKISDLFSAKPVIIHGRYTKAASGTIRLKGKMAGQDYVREINVDFPENAPNHGVLSTLWARTKIDDLMSQSVKYDTDEDEFVADVKSKIKNDITQLGLNYNLMTEFTSFVAVEERIVTSGGATKKVVVPVQMPAGVNTQSTNDPYGFIMQATVGRRNRKSAAMVNSPANVQSVTLSKKVKGTYVVMGDSDSSPALAPTPVPRIISGGIVNSKATNLVKPQYPAAAKAVGASGTVNVQVTIDESGNVVAAQAVSGHPLLRAAAEAAARASTFAPTIIGGAAIKTQGIISYNFVNPNNPTITLPAANQAEEEKSPITGEINPQTAEREKFHFWIFALVERLRKNEKTLTPNETKFVSDGKAEVDIWLTTKSFAAFNRLKELGFEIVEDKKAKLVVGRIAPEKLAELANISEVQYVVPSVK